MISLKTYDNKMQPDIESFYQKCFADLGWDYEPHENNSDTTNIDEVYMSNGCMWCLYDDNQLIGTVAVRTIDKENNIAELKRLYVLKEYQGRNYGDMLFQTALNYAIEKKYSRICADTRSDRGASQYLMRKYGFREIPKYNDNPFAELYFELELPGGYVRDGKRRPAVIL
jgi:ribosomal protein S18 acetylase RimI-like enzyme